ncbi:S-layer homology domain-containing protein [Paenibacillus filicis]|uniref:S-layer homology domain-containing protein n=1 Tax=Paenibacillus gyeongsangnamensis TaxID=3388067 RepID=A0ABT4Q391_9BACL|nr:S-layer homology domain-containing protein [Paenibacillus filicis]MCZ8511346.1 S-layer homology domain-containing protein [Paenibacillus filicis]
MKRFSRPFTLLPAAALLLGATWLQNDLRSASAGGPSPDTATDSGKAVYEQHCLACHAAEGRGSDNYPSLVSDQAKKGVLKNYDKAYAFISRNMPNNSPGSLRDEEYKAVTKYVLGLNGIPTDYSDIAGHWASKEILALDDKRYVDGYTENGKLLFKPDQPITRAEFIRYFVKAKEWYLTSRQDTDLMDVQKNGDKPYILTAIDYGLIQGYPDHTFKPKNPITRAEIAAILTRSELLRVGGDAAYKDVRGDYWAAKEIAAVSEAQLFGGYEDGTFRPEQKITRAEAASVIYRLLNPS